MPGVFYRLAMRLFCLCSNPKGRPTITSMHETKTQEMKGLPWGRTGRWQAVQRGADPRRSGCKARVGAPVCHSAEVTGRRMEGGLGVWELCP